MDEYFDSNSSPISLSWSLYILSPVFPQLSIILFNGIYITCLPPTPGLLDFNMTVKNRRISVYLKFILLVIFFQGNQQKKAKLMRIYVTAMRPARGSRFSLLLLHRQPCRFLANPAEPISNLCLNFLLVMVIDEYCNVYFMTI